MNPWVVFVPFLLQIAVALVIGLSWVGFIRTIVRNSRKKNNPSSSRRVNPPSSSSATRSRTNWDRRSVIENYAKTDSSTSRDQNRNSGKRKTRTTSSQPKSESIFERFMKQSPQELYRLLENRLPSHYQAELRRIFNSPQWRREVWRFLKREDVWPLLQSILRSEQTKGQKERAGSPFFAETRAAEQEENVSAGIATTMEREAALLEEEYSSLLSSYDALSDNLDRETSSLTSSEEKTSLLDSRKQEAKNTQRKKTVANQRWLRDAILAKEILERPDF